VPWEHVGECGSAQSDPIEAAREVRRGVRFLRRACGSAPPACKVEVMWHEHDLGEYPTVGVFWGPPATEPPWAYISLCETALERFNSGEDQAVKTERKCPKPEESQPFFGGGRWLSTHSYDSRDVFLFVFLAFWIGFTVAVVLIAIGILPHPSFA
jgi:hypothetical protein